MLFYIIEPLFKFFITANIKTRAQRRYKELNKLKSKYPKIIKEVRGKGLLIGLKLKVDQTKFINKLFENKLLTIKAADNVVRILPPLNVSNKEITIAFKIIEKVCKSYN